MTKRILAWLLAVLALCAMPHAVPAASPGSTQAQQGMRHVLEGKWTAVLPQEQMVFQFQGGRYAFFLNGQPIEEGAFVYVPDGRLQYQVTAGRNAGQRGENRIAMQGQSFSLYAPDGSCCTFTRMAAPQPQAQPGPGATPLEGRWIFARPGPVSFGYVFSNGKYFYCERNGAQLSSGTIEMNGYQITFRHDSGQTVRFRYQHFDNTTEESLVIASEDPNVDPITFVRPVAPSMHRCRQAP